uniref:N-acyl-aromatic-L-amino acid amidohydrolase n=1 Tax=Neogobius melanostomus TaxID=47308 RepID=A0A8C6U7J7_9GOBI
MDLVSYPAFSRVAITGGTHGNELSGVYIVREMQRQNVAQVGSVSISPILVNLPAIDACRRYIEKDLNRCFTDALLSTPLTDSSPYELRRAHELNSQLGPKGSPQAMDLVCDLHNTTSNMGLCFIFDFDCIPSTLPNTYRVIYVDTSKSESYSVDSVAKHGFAIEVGPQPHGVLRADIYNMMKEAVDHTVDWLNKFNAGTIFEGGNLEVFVKEKSVDYPRNPETSELTAAIHPQLQDNDFKLLQRGDPIFMSFTGETVNYEGEELYPFFINECAYYEKKIAFHLAKKKMLTIPPISLKKD